MGDRAFLSYVLNEGTVVDFSNGSAKYLDGGNEAVVS
jgi:hypothetical protein